jgi:hypothetical protein
MKNLLILILLAASISASAQQYYDDAQVRFNLGLEKRITKKFALTLDQQDRFTQNVAVFSRASFDIGLQYKITKWLKVKADYVFIQKRTKLGYFTPRNWYYVAVVLKHEVGKWNFFYRNLAQGRMAEMNSEEAGVTKFYDRNKITIRHETTRRTSFWVAGEVYIPLNSPQAKGIERSRSYLGTTIKTFKKQSLDLYFMLQIYHQRNKWFDQEYRYPTTLNKRDWIYGVSYNIAF